MAFTNDVDVIQARQTLIAAHAQSGEEQQARRAEIVAAFNAWWASEPSEQEFAAVMGRLVLFPEMLYRMVRGR